MNIKYTKQLLEPIVKESKSYSECLKKLGLRIAGGNYKLLQKNIDRFEIDSSHMLHQAANRGKEIKKFEGLTKPDSIKKRLIKERGKKCENCGLFKWMDFDITLELEHIDGNNRNNLKNNLKLLCPNCHALTPTWRNRKRV